MNYNDIFQCGGCEMLFLLCLVFSSEASSGLIVNIIPFCSLLTSFLENGMGVVAHD